MLPYPIRGANGAFLAAWALRTFRVLIVVLVVLISGCAAERSPANRNLQIAKGLFYALKMYAGDHEGKYPQFLQQLVPNYLNEEQWANVMYRDPVSDRRYDWLYFAAPNDSVQISWILLASPSSQLYKDENRRQRIVVQADGVAEVVPEEKFQSRIRSQGSPALPTQQTAATP